MCQNQENIVYLGIHTRDALHKTGGRFEGIDDIQFGKTELVYFKSDDS
jgi:hypothetical protein